MVTHGPGETGPELVIVAAEWGYHEADGEYAVFAVVVDGMDVVSAINEIPVDDDMRPVDEVLILEVVVLEAVEQNGGDEPIKDIWPSSAGTIVMLGIAMIVVVVLLIVVKRKRS